MSAVMTTGRKRLTEQSKKPVKPIEFKHQTKIKLQYTTKLTNPFLTTA
jgi:hypothetical protein